MVHHCRSSIDLSLPGPRKVSPPAHRLHLYLGVGGGADELRFVAPVYMGDTLQ